MSKNTDTANTTETKLDDLLVRMSRLEALILEHLPKDRRVRAARNLSGVPSEDLREHRRKTALSVFHKLANLSRHAKLDQNFQKALVGTVADEVKGLQYHVVPYSILRNRLSMLACFKGDNAAENIAETLASLSAELQITRICDLFPGETSLVQVVTTHAWRKSRGLPPVEEEEKPRKSVFESFADDGNADDEDESEDSWSFDTSEDFEKQSED